MRYWKTHKALMQQIHCEQCLMSRWTMWLQMHMNGTWVTWLIRTAYWPKQRQLTPKLFWSHKATTDALNNAPSSKTIYRIQHVDAFSLCTLDWWHSLCVWMLRFDMVCVLWRRLCVDLDLVVKDSENNLWLWLSICLWDDGIFILAAMNYWGVESAASRTGVCVRVSVSVCAYMCDETCWKTP